MGQPAAPAQAEFRIAAEEFAKAYTPGRPETATSYLAALTNLHNELQTDGLVYVVSNEQWDTGSGTSTALKHGIYTVKTAGVRLGGENQQMVMGQVEGVQISDFSGPGYNIRFGVDGEVVLHNGAPQPIRDLAITSELGHDTTRPQFVLGPTAIKKAIAENPTESPAFNLQLAIAAASQGIHIPLEDVDVTVDIQTELRQSVLRHMAKQVTGAEVVSQATEKSPGPRLLDIKNLGGEPRISYNAQGITPAKLGPLARILGLTQIDLKKHLREGIIRLEEEILEGTASASRWTEVEVGNRRLVTYVSNVFAD